MEEHRLSERLTELLNMAAKNDLEKLTNQQPVKPWLVYIKEEENKPVIVESKAEENKKAIRNLKKQLREVSGEVVSFLIGFDGKITLKDKKELKGLVYQLGEAEDPSSYTYVVGYNKSINGLVRVSESHKGIVGQSPNILSNNEE